MRPEASVGFLIAFTLVVLLVSVFATVRRGRTFSSAGPWTLFALFVLFGGWLFLRACGTWPLFGWQRDYCPAPVDRRAYAREVETGEGLKREIHAAEMALAEKPPCPTPVPPRPPAPRPREAPVQRGPREPTPHPVLTPQQRRESQEIDRKVENKHGKRGRLQFTLSWKTLDDLDINVDCPGGRITGVTGQRGPGICGDGVKDIDANRNLVENVSNDPVENVTWAEDVPEGRYVIEIINFRPKSRNGSRVPFTLRMRWGDQERICRDVVTTIADPEMKEVNGQKISGTERKITWDSSGDLPDCNFQVFNTVRGGPGK